MTDARHVLGVVPSGVGLPDFGLLEVIGDVADVVEGVLRNWRGFGRGDVAGATLEYAAINLSEAIKGYMGAKAASEELERKVPGATTPPRFNNIFDGGKI